ncbi:nyn-1 [Pristionchus pacificus]|uniref:Zc3h12a-like Ribonuclease NYN domain-containing protein n=1 Tax=Pristionchus pacificus TaxID=54126 RepID=A0A8R1V5L4_PRIPA|nr:nyn-1 [Pristionchus pacificus]
MELEEDWGSRRENIPSTIYELEQQTHPYSTQRRTKHDGRNRQPMGPKEVSERLYNAISVRHGINAEGGAISRDNYFQNMGELNYPADEQFRKESQITKNRLERDKNMKRKKKMIDIKDSSTDEFVIPCTFPSAMNYEEKLDEKSIVPPSVKRIEEFLKLVKPTTRWSDGKEEREEPIEDIIILEAAAAASTLEGNTFSICLSFEEYPPIYKQRREGNDAILLRTIVIDGCAVMKQVNFNYEVPWNPTGGATNTFKGNKLLIVKPLVELAMRFLLLGHKTVIILPTYYMNPVFAGVRQKVDNLEAFNKLVQTGIVHFIEEDVLEKMHQNLYDANKRFDGTWVSTNDLERIVDAFNRSLEFNRNRLGTEEEIDKRIWLAKFDLRLTPFFYDNKLVLPLHMSTEQKHLLFSDTLLEYRGIPLEKVADIVANQLTMEDQKKILLSLQNVFDLPLRLLRGMMLYRRILKEIEDNEEEKSIIKDTAAIRDLEEEVQRAFEMEPDICNRSNN